MKIANYNYHQDLSKIILWQYTNAEKFNAIVNKEQEFMDSAVTQFWHDFNVNIFNLATCNTFGLELWGRLLGIARPTYTTGGHTYEYNDEQYRLMLRAKIYLLTFDGSCYALNQFFKMVFPEYPVIIEEYNTMVVRISFTREPADDIKRILSNPDFLPRPSGVQYIMNWGVDYDGIFGFEGMTHGGKEAPSFTEATGDEFDPDTDGGGTFMN